MNTLVETCSDSKINKFVINIFRDLSNIKINDKYLQ